MGRRKRASGHPAALLNAQIVAAERHIRDNAAIDDRDGVVLNGLNRSAGHLAIDIH